MDTVGIVFLGLIALSSAVQAAFLIGLARSAQKAAQRLDEVQARLDRDLRPSLDNLNRITRNVADITDLASIQAQRVDVMVADTMEKVESVTETLRSTALRLAPLGEVAGLFQAFQKGVEMYRNFTAGRSDPSRRARASKSYEDEHLFI